MKLYKKREPGLPYLNPAYGSRTKADGLLRDVTDKVLEENRAKNNGPNSVSQSFVGTDEIMLKTTTLDGIRE